MYDNDHRGTATLHRQQQRRGISVFVWKSGRQYSHVSDARSNRIFGIVFLFDLLAYYWALMVRCWVRMGAGSDKLEEM